MRSIAFIGLGIGFMLMGAGLFALTFRKPAKPAPANPNKSQLREQAALAEEAKKMKIAAGATAGFGALLVLFSFL
jgi:hypothetical protein